jgi:cell division FtsZ-interacting protein ZapD
VDLKRFLQEQGMKLMSDPRIGKLLQDERVMKTMMQAFQLKGKVQESFDQRVESIAKMFNLATKSEMRELKRALRKMEGELEKAKKNAAG